MTNFDKNFKPGTILISQETLDASCRLLSGDIPKNVEENVWAFSCLLQLLEAIVIHEQIVYDYYSMLSSRVLPVFDRAQNLSRNDVAFYGSGLEKAVGIFNHIPLHGMSELPHIDMIFERKDKSIFSFRTKNPIFEFATASELKISYRPNPGDISLFQKYFD